MGSLARAVNRATVDGFVAIGLSEDHQEVEQIRRAGLPIVMVDSAASFPEHAAVDVDDEGNAVGIEVLNPPGFSGEVPDGQ